MSKHLLATVASVGAFAAGGIGIREALAHCDGLDGPVVQAAKSALASGNVNVVLIWVQPKDEAELRSAFQQVLVVRRQGPKAGELADRWFFETAVRLHRAGEGASYTGLAPAGRDLGPAIPAADKAVETGSVAALNDLLVKTIHQGLREQFTALRALREYDPDDVAAGRKYVQAYVEFIHYVERLHEAAVTPARGHYSEPKPPR